MIGKENPLVSKNFKTATAQFESYIDTNASNGFNFHSYGDNDALINGIDGIGFGLSLGQE